MTLDLPSPSPSHPPPPPIPKLRLPFAVEDTAAVSAVHCAHIIPTLEPNQYMKLVLLLSCGIAEILLNIFIRRMEGWRTRLSAENESRLHFSTTEAAFFVCTIKVCFTFYDWSAAYSMTNRCNLPSFIVAAVGVEQTV